MMEIAEEEDLHSSDFSSTSLYHDQPTSTSSPPKPKKSTRSRKKTSPKSSSKSSKLPPKSSSKPHSTKPSKPSKPSPSLTRQTRTKKSPRKYSQYITNKYSIFMMTGIVLVMIFYKAVDVLTEGKQRFDIRVDMGGMEDMEEGKGQGKGSVLVGDMEAVQIGGELDLFGVEGRQEWKEFKERYRDKYRYTLYRPQITKQSDNAEQQQIPQQQPNLAQVHLCSTQLSAYPQLLTLTQQNLPSPPSSPSSPPSLQTLLQICQKLSKSQLQTLDKTSTTKFLNLPESPQLNQPTLCILSYGLPEFNEQVYERFVRSVQKQEYASYRVVVIDDGTEKGMDTGRDRDREGWGSRIVGFFSRRGKGKMEVVRNRRRVGKLGSYFLHAQRCLQQDVIVYLDAKDYFIGTQVFRILGTLFQNQSTWLAYPNLSLTLSSSSPTTPTTSLQPQQISHKISPRASATPSQNFPQMIAHRTQLIEKLPLQYFMQYRKNRKNPFWSPGFYHSKSIRLLGQVLVELCGVAHVVEIGRLVDVQGGQIDAGRELCSQEMEELTRVKSMYKTPLLPLPSLSSQPQSPLPRPQPPPHPTLLHTTHQSLLSCLKNPSLDPRNPLPKV